MSILWDELHETAERGDLQNVLKLADEEELISAKDLNIRIARIQMAFNGNACVEEGDKLKSGNKDRKEK